MWREVLGVSGMALPGAVALGVAGIRAYGPVTVVYKDRNELWEDSGSGRPLVY